MKRSFFLICAVLIAHSSVVSAQEPEQVTLRFLSFPKNAAPEPVELVTGEGEVIEVKTPTNALSEPYKVKRLATWSFGKLEAAAGKDGKPSFNSYGSAPSIASPDQIILLIRKGKENKEGLQVIPIDNNSNNFGGGKFFFMNAARVDIAGMLGGTKFSLKPGNQTIIEPKEKTRREGTTSDGFFTEFYFRKEEEARPFFSSTGPHNEKARRRVFFYHDPKHDRLRMHTIRDYIP